MPRTFSLRLDDTLSERLADVASIMGRSQADLIRLLITPALDHMLESPTFQQAVQVRQEALDRLATFAVPAENPESPPPAVLASVD